MAETNIATENSSRWSSTRMTLSVIAATIVGSVIMMLVSEYKAGWEKMLRLDCQSNLRQMGLLCREYADIHDGHFPSTWVELNLVGDNSNWAKLLRCPSINHETGIWAKADLWSDYRLLPGRSTNDSPDKILAIEPLGNHGSAGANVLFVDGGTQWWPASRVLEATVETTTNDGIK